MKRKVLFISHEATLGGAARSLLEMLAALRKYIDPVVILPQKGLMESCLQNINVRYYIVSFFLSYGRIGSGSQENDDLIFINNYEATDQLMEIIKKEEVTLIYSNSSTGNIGAITALKANLPHIWHIRELLEEHFSCGFWDKRLKKELFSVTNQFITISHCVEQKYREVYHVDSACIYDAVDYQEYFSDIKRSLFSKDGFINIMLAGAISKGKGQADAVKAVELLIKRGIGNVRLYIIGSGTMTHLWWLEQYIMSHDLGTYVKMIPFQEELGKFRRECIFSLTCSKMEALGRVTVEAMMAGLVIIGANTGGTLELIGEKEERGFLYAEGNAEGLADTIQRAIEQSENMRLLKQQSAQNFAKINFDSEKYAQKIWEVIDKCAVNYKSTKETALLIGKLEERYQSLSGRDTGKPSSLFGTANHTYYKNMFLLMDKWFQIKHKGSSLIKFFECEKLYHIAIYGMGQLGYHLFYELMNSNIKIVYVVDRTFERSDSIAGGIEIRNSEDSLEAVDAVIVTVIKEEKEVKKKLKQKFGYRVVGLKEIIDFCLGQTELIDKGYDNGDRE